MTPISLIRSFRAPSFGLSRFPEKDNAIVALISPNLTLHFDYLVDSPEVSFSKSGRIDLDVGPVNLPPVAVEPQPQCGPGPLAHVGQPSSPKKNQILHKIVL